MTTQHSIPVGVDKLAELETLLAARRQATWQKFKSAGENKALWFRVIDLINNRIRAKEREIKRSFSLPEFRAKRGWGT